MNKIVKAATLITSGILVGVVARKFVLSSTHSDRPASTNFVPQVKNLIDKNALSEDVNNYFV